MSGSVQHHQQSLMSQHDHVTAVKHCHYHIMLSYVLPGMWIERREWKYGNM